MRVHELTTRSRPPAVGAGHLPRRLSVGGGRRRRDAPRPRAGPDRGHGAGVPGAADGRRRQGRRAARSLLLFLRILRVFGKVRACMRVFVQHSLNTIVAGLFAIPAPVSSNFVYAHALKRAHKQPIQPGNRARTHTLHIAVLCDSFFAKGLSCKLRV